MQKIQKVFCPSCGAPVKFLDGRDYTFCTSCGHQLFREDTQLDRKLKHKEIKMKYANQREERELAKKKLEAKEQRNAGLTMLGIIAVLVIGLILLMMII